MKAKVDREDDYLLRDIDLSTGVRGKYADRFTPESREAFGRECEYGMVHDLTRYSLEQIRVLEGALFRLLVLAGSASMQRGRPYDLAGLVAELGGTRLINGALLRCLESLAVELQWLNQPRDEPYTGPGSFNPTLDRLDVIFNEARALKEKVDRLVERRLARSGMSEQEIARKTEETARLWLAA